MATLLRQLQAAQRVNKPSLIAEIVTVIRSLEKTFVDKNKEQLEKDSTDIHGRALGFYSQATEYITTNMALLGGVNNIKRAGDPYTGVDTGDWFEGFYMKVENGTLFFGSDDEKNDEILRGDHWLTTEFFGLTDENLREVIEKSILPLFIKVIRIKLGI